MINRINNFISHISQNPIELYSEFGLQHELAIFLRNNYNDIKVWLEYPSNKIFNPLPTLVKKEIDIYIVNQVGQRFVIELKMPKDDGGVPNAMYNAIIDVKFLEQLKFNNIDGCYSILFTSCTKFRNPIRANAGIYEFYKGENVNIQSINTSQLPTFLHKNGPINLLNNYQTNWHSYIDINQSIWDYYILEV